MIPILTHPDYVNFLKVCMAVFQYDQDNHVLQNLMKLINYFEIYSNF